MSQSGKGKFENEWKEAFEGAELTPSQQVWESIRSILTRSERNRGAAAGFESGWKNAFKGAEIEPSKNVWNSINATLLHTENARMRKRVVRYQRLAAASVGILAMLGVYGWMNINASRHTNLSENALNSQSSDYSMPKNEVSDLTQKNTGFVKSENSAMHSEPQPIPDQSLLKSKTPVPNQDNNQNPILVFSRPINNNNLNRDKANIDHVSTIADAEKNLAIVSLNSSKESGRNYFGQGDISELNLVNISKLPHFFAPNDYVIAYRLADARPAVIVRNKKTSVSENKWAAIGFSAGSFSPGTTGNELMSSSLSSNQKAYTLADFRNTSSTITKSEKVKLGTSMAMAISAGKRIFKRWVLQGSITYLNQNSTTEEKIISAAPVGTTVSTLDAANWVTYESQQDINSTFQYLSVPFTLGYMLVDRKFGLQINGGVSPDFFLKNSVYNETTQIETVNSAGSGEVFKSVSLSGLGSIEISHSFFTHYRLSLAPGVKYSLTPIYNNNFLASAKPFVADVSLKFRYTF